MDMYTITSRNSHERAAAEHAARKWPVHPFNGLLDWVTEVGPVVTKDTAVCMPLADSAAWYTALTLLPAANPETQPA